MSAWRRHSRVFILGARAPNSEIWCCRSGTRGVEPFRVVRLPSDWPSAQSPHYDVAEDDLRDAA